MIIEPFCKEDITSFLTLAAAEGWVAEAWELEHLLAEFPQGCFAARSENGGSTGFVTAVRHGNSGWIGNLIVAAQYRGRGLGERLFKRAFEALQMAAVETIWLTASQAGTPLYEKYGFSGIDKIIRWVGTGRGRHAVQVVPAQQNLLSVSSQDCDTQAWGDRRSTLLAVTASRGTLLQVESGFMVLQPCGAALQFGPFSAVNDATAEKLFDVAATTVAVGKKILLDAPASNRSALRLFNRRNMRIAGSTALMYAGRKPEYQSKFLYGLATMGSCG